MLTPTYHQFMIIHISIYSGGMVKKSMDMFHANILRIPMFLIYLFLELIIIKNQKKLAKIAVS